MTAIRPAVPADASRIAEMIVVNYRTNFYPFFRNDAFYFKELNVLGIAADYADGSPSGCRTFVYDDGAVKGVINIRGDEVEKLYVEPQFQSQGIGAELMQFAIERFAVKWLWALEYNIQVDACAFFELDSRFVCDFAYMVSEQARFIRTNDLFSLALFEFYPHNATGRGLLFRINAPQTFS